jgi:hypothetical protein
MGFERKVRPSFKTFFLESYLKTRLQKRFFEITLYLKNVVVP